MENILLVESFYKGSHKYWADGVLKTFAPGVKGAFLSSLSWQDAMLYGGLELSEKIPVDTELVIATSTVDVSQLKTKAPIFMYFHENQYAYPQSENFSNREFRSKAFSVINLTSALAASKLIFNSNFNKESFFKNARRDLQSLNLSSADRKLSGLEKSAVVLPVGINIIEKEKVNYEPTILWNHRWEEDKGVSKFKELVDKIPIEFSLNIVGEQPDTLPVELSALKSEATHFGFVADRGSYEGVLLNSLLLPVTSKQEFFGISVLEATSAGVLPLLPNRLSYPQLVPDELKKVILYDSEEELLNKVEFYLQHPLLVREMQQKLREMASCYSWESLRNSYGSKLLKL